VLQIQVSIVETVRNITCLSEMFAMCFATVRKNFEITMHIKFISDRLDCGDLGLFLLVISVETSLLF
jgi:hypothetical protein